MQRNKFLLLLVFSLTALFSCKRPEEPCVCFEEEPEIIIRDLGVNGAGSPSFLFESMDISDINITKTNTVLWSHYIQFSVNVDAKSYDWMVDNDLNKFDTKTFGLSFNRIIDEDKEAYFHNVYLILERECGCSQQVKYDTLTTVLKVIHRDADPLIGTFRGKSEPWEDEYEIEINYENRYEERHRGSTSLNWTKWLHRADEFRRMTNTGAYGYGYLWGKGDHIYRHAFTRTRNPNMFASDFFSSIYGGMKFSHACKINENNKDSIDCWFEVAYYVEPFQPGGPNDPTPSGIKTFHFKGKRVK